MADKSDLLDVIEAERSRHPYMNERDLQKLVYQSVFGGDHLFEEPVGFMAELHREWASLPGAPSSTEPSLQGIDPEGRTARIHLGVCKRRGVDVDRLGRLLLGQPRRDGKRSDFERRWQETIALATAGRIPFSDVELERLGLPDRPPRHSARYGRASYRIVHDASDRAFRNHLHRLGVI